MNLLKKRFANDRKCASPNKGKDLSKSVKKIVRGYSSEIQPDGPSANGLIFVADFTREHSRPGLNIASIEISGCF